jgi:hypothetical protein
LEQISEAAQEENNEHSKEWLNAFIQEDEEVAALKLTTEEAEDKADIFLTPWEMELEMLEDWLNNLELVGEMTEFEMSEKVTEQQVSQGETVVLKFAIEWTFISTEEEDEDGMGNHDDLPICRK